MAIKIFNNLKFIVMDFCLDWQGVITKHLYFSVCNNITEALQNTAIEENIGIRKSI